MADLSNIFKVVNRFLFSKGQPSGMFTDTPISQQPKGTVHNAWGVDKQNTEEKGGGYYNANGMDLHSKVPEGYVPRGRHFVEDAEKMVIFSYNEGTTTSEIGYIDHKTGEYHKVIDDNDIEGCDLDFGMNEYIPIVSKYMKDGNCYDVHIYWTNGSYYKKLNIDNPCPPIDCDDIYLLKCSAVPTPTSYKSENGGRDLESGVYQYLGRYEDVDNNTTNWFQINAPVSIESPNNIAGEKSDESIYVKFSNLSVEYNILQIAVIKTIDGHTSAHMLSKKYYNTNSIEFVHRSPTQEMYEIPIEEILLKKNGYFRGYDLFQHDGRLFPYNILGEANEQ